MHEQKEDMWVHTYTHTEEDLYLLCLALFCRQKIFNCPLKTWEGAPGPWSAYPLRCKDAVLWLLFPFILSCWACCALPKYLQKLWRQWELMHGNMILLPGQADSWGRQTLVAVLRQACQRLKANHSPVARESTLNIKPVRSPSLTKWFWMQEHLPSKVWEGFCKKLWFCYIHIFLKEK